MKLIDLSTESNEITFLLEQERDRTILAHLVMLLYLNKCAEIFVTKDSFQDYSLNQIYKVQFK